MTFRELSKYVPYRSARTYYKAKVFSSSKEIARSTSPIGIEITGSKNFSIMGNKRRQIEVPSEEIDSRFISIFSRQKPKGHMRN